MVKELDIYIYIYILRYTILIIAKKRFSWLSLPSGKPFSNELEHHHFYIGKSTINGPFSIAMSNYQRGSMVKTWGYNRYNHTYTILIAKLVNITWFSCLAFLVDN